MSWHCKISGAYARTSTEAIENATEIWNVLGSAGWSLNAVCGVLGNMGAESGYNPWRWQSDKIGVSTGSPWTNKGYGLVQFTPAGKYINSAQSYTGFAPNFSDKSGGITDGIAQMLFVNEKADYYPTKTYPISYADYKVSTDNAGTLAVVWLYNYERPGDPSATLELRREEANYWWDVLSGLPPIPPTPVGSRRFDFFYYYFGIGGK